MSSGGQRLEETKLKVEAFVNSMEAEDTMKSVYHLKTSLVEQNQKGDTQLKTMKVVLV